MAWSSVVAFVAVGTGYSQITAPDDLARTSYTPTPRAIALSWDDNSNNETHFNVQLSSDGGTNWNALGQVGTGTTSFSGTLPAGNDLLIFRVLATDGTNFSSPSNVISVEGTDPETADTDGDGMADGPEVLVGLDPYYNDAYEDADGDRYPNVFEYARGSDPNDAESIPAPDYIAETGATLSGNVYPTIQGALDQVNADHRIVLVRDGLYSGSGNVNLALSGSYSVLLLGEHGARETTLEGSGSSRLVNTSGDAVLDGLTFRNGAAADGGALYSSGGDLLVVNCVFSGNHATGNGGAICQSSGNTFVIHSTFLGNSAGSDGAAIYVSSGEAQVAKSILWNTGSANEAGVSGTTAVVTITESIVRGGFSGTGNLNIDPVTRADGHLTGGSPAIDSGGILTTALLDMDGEERPAGSTTDLGADEWVDTDTDGLPDWWELDRFGSLSATSAGDPDGDGSTNLQEYAAGSDPADYYSQTGGLIAPTLTIVDGNNQVGPPGTFASEQLIVQVMSGTTPLINAPVSFSVSGTQFGWVSTVNTGTALVTSLSVQTGSDGRANAYFKFASAEGTVTDVAVAAGGTGSSLREVALSIPQTGLRMWLDAERGITKDGSGNISAWADQSGNSHTATQSTGSYQPVFLADELNGHPVVKFNGTNQFMTLSTGLNTSTALPLTLVIVSKHATNPRGVFDSAPLTANVFRFLNNCVEIWNQSPTVSLSWSSTGAVTVVTGTQDAGNARKLSAYVNGVQSGSTQTGNTSQAVVSGPQIGRYNNPTNSDHFYYGGSIAEILYYNRGISESERLTVEWYLYWKYGVGNSPTLPSPVFEVEAELHASPFTAYLTGSTGATIHYTSDGSTPTSASPVYTGSIPISATTTIKALAIRPGYNNSVVSQKTYVLDSAANFSASGLKLWLRSDVGVTQSGSNSVQAWHDQSGNGAHASQNSSGNQPSYQASVVGTIPALRFNGTNQFLGLTSALSGTSKLPLTFFVVTKGATNPKGLFDSAPNTANVFRFLDGNVEFWNQSPTISLSWSGTDVSVTSVVGSTLGTARRMSAFINRSQQGGTQTGGMAPVVFTSPQIGRYNSVSGTNYCFNGDLLEVLLFDRALSVLERGQVERYLVARYGAEDSDADGLTDSWEISMFGNLTATADDDPDGDGLTNSDELSFGTDPTDADGDDDGLEDGEELTAGTSPFTQDSDSDGMLDGYEVVNNLNPLGDDRQLDKDGDGVPNLWEFVNGSAASDKEDIAPDWVVDPAHASDSPTDNIVATIAIATGTVPVDNGNVAQSYKSILVKSGSYAESVTLPGNKRIALVAERGGNVKLVGASVNLDVLTVSERSIVDGFVVRRPQADVEKGIVTGAGIVINGSSANGIGRVVNCIVSGNRWGVAFGSNPYGSADVEYCTVFGNERGGLSAPYRDRITTVRNCVIWNPAAGGANQFASDAHFVTSLVGNLVYGGQFGGTNADPKLNVDGTLQAGSAAIDAASGLAVEGDIHGEIRPYGAARDMGADERIDNDLDGLADHWEFEWFGALTETANGDPDGDTLVNFVEELFRLDPTEDDSSGNGKSGIFDALTTVSPLFYPSAWVVDTDRDGLSDGWEYYWQTDPNSADSNGDGISDNAVWNGIDPLDTDLDGDGISNADELAMGTNPLAQDTDRDGHNDDVDWYPTDPDRWEEPALNPSDTTGPVLNLTQPDGVVVTP